MKAAGKILTEGNLLLESIESLLDTIVYYISDELEDIRNQALKQLEIVTKTLPQLSFYDSLLPKLSSLSQKMRSSSSDDFKKKVMLRLVHNYIVLVHNREAKLELLLESHMRDLSLALLNTLVLDLENQKILEPATPAPGQLSYPVKHFKYFRNNQVANIALSICKSLAQLGKYDFLHLLLIVFLFLGADVSLVWCFCLITSCN